MSYDLVVFDPKPALRGRAAFMSWYDARTLWADSLDYNEPSNASPALQNWFREMIRTFPPLNGPLRAPESEYNPWVAGYTICTDLVVVAFISEKASVAYETTRHLAAQHGVGVFNASGDGSAWFPTNSHTLELAHANDGKCGGGLERLLRQLGRRREP
jgi:hypothetical protein